MTRSGQPGPRQRGRQQVGAAEREPRRAQPHVASVRRRFQRLHPLEGSGPPVVQWADLQIPPAPGMACRSELATRPPLKRMRTDLAKSACRGTRDPADPHNCLFGVSVMVDRGAARQYQAGPPERESGGDDHFTSVLKP